MKFTHSASASTICKVKPCMQKLSIYQSRTHFLLKWPTNCWDVKGQSHLILSQLWFGYIYFLFFLLCLWWWVYPLGDYKCRCRCKHDFDIAGNCQSELYFFEEELKFILAILCREWLLIQLRIGNNLWVFFRCKIHLLYYFSLQATSINWKSWHRELQNLSVIYLLLLTYRLLNEK